MTDRNRRVKPAPAAGTLWLAHQIALASQNEAPQPRPARSNEGQIVKGSTTDVVLRWLLTRHRVAYWTRQQIIVATGTSQKAVDWALIFLRLTGRIEVAIDSRNPRYLRYRVAESERKLT